MIKELWERAKAFVHEWQEVAVSGPAALLLLVLAYYTIPAVDPRAGIDGFGDLYATLLGVIKGIVVCFSAWWSKRTYLMDLSKEDETWLLNRSAQAPLALGVMVVDRLTWAGWLLFWWWVISH